jgi:hypothetical protein
VVRKVVIYIKLSLRCTNELFLSFNSHQKQKETSFEESGTQMPRLMMIVILRDENLKGNGIMLITYDLSLMNIVATLRTKSITNHQLVQS